MMQLRLSNDRTEIDMNVLATAFGLSSEALDGALSLGAIRYHYELGPGDTATPRTVFRSTETGQRVTLDRIGRIFSRMTTFSADTPMPCSEACLPEAAKARAADAPAPIDPSQVSGQPPENSASRRLDVQRSIAGNIPASDPVAISFDAPRSEL